MNAVERTIYAGVVGNALEGVRHEAAPGIAGSLAVAAERVATSHVLPAVQRVRVDPRAPVLTKHCNKHNKLFQAFCGRFETG